MKKILFIIPGSYIAGTERIMLKVMHGFQTEGYSIVCFANGWNDGKFIAELEALNIPYKVAKLGFIYWQKPLWTLDTILHYPTAIISFIKLKKKIKPDIIYHSSFRSIFMLYPFIGGIKNILHVHDYPESGGILSKFFFKYLKNKIDSFIAVSDSIKESILNQGIDKNKVNRIYNGISIPVKGFLPPSNWNNKQEIKLGIVGQVIPRKGHHILIKAIHALPLSVRNLVSLKIFGDGDINYINQLKNQIIEYKLEDRIKWMGFEKNQEAIYQQIDVVVVPTITKEPFGLVAIEPSLYGKLAIVANSGGLPEIVTDKVNGLVFQPNDIESLKEKIQWIINNSSKIPNLINNAQKNIYSYFDEKNMVGEIISKTFEQ